MPIKIENPETIPELKYENVYILSFKVTQEKSQDQVFRVEYEYILYAERPDGMKIFNDKTKVKDVIEDFEGTIGAEADAQDQIDLLGAFAGIEQALATLIRIRQGLNNAVS